jgi:DNA-binding CsgD family transcriptional regulator
MTDPWGLTPREAEVMTILVEKGSSKAVARVLGISSKTIDIHVTSAVSKMRARNRLDGAVAWDRWIGRMPLPELSEFDRVRMNGVLLHRLQQALPRLAA